MVDVNYFFARKELFVTVAVAKNINHNSAK